MGGAILRSALLSCEKFAFGVCGRTPQRSEELALQFGVAALHSVEDAAKWADIVFLCVKPQACEPPLTAIAPYMSGKTLVSVMAGITTEQIRGFVGDECKVVRTMPNMPALIGKGLTIIADGTDAAEYPPEIDEIFQACGEICRVPEKYMDAAMVSAACSPAFVFMFIEAMADAGVYAGLSRADAQKMAAVSVMGSAALALELGEPAKLKDSICSPSGSTIKGVAALENSGYRGAIIRAYLACLGK